MLKAKTHALGAFLPWKTASCAEEASPSASATVALEVDAVGFVLGAIEVQEIRARR